KSSKFMCLQYLSQPNSCSRAALCRSACAITLRSPYRQQTIEILLRSRLMARPIVFSTEEPWALPQHREKDDLSLVILVVGLRRELLAQKFAFSHECVPRIGESREVDVLDELPIVRRRRCLVSC